MKMKIDLTGTTTYIIIGQVKEVQYKYFGIPYFLIQFSWNFEFYSQVTVHKCAETIQGQKLYEEIRYVYYYCLIVTE